MSILLKLVTEAAKAMPDRARDELIDSPTFIGRAIDRVDGREKVTGGARFAAEYPLDNLAYAALAYSTIARGRIETIDTGAASQSPGVIAVITHANALKMRHPPYESPGSGSDASGTTAPVLNTDEIFWNGQPIAMVVADTAERAEAAAALIHARYREQEAELSFDHAKATARVPKLIVGEDNIVKHGDAEDALRTAAHRVDQTYTTPRYNHNALEPHAVTAAWDGDNLTVYDATQHLRGVVRTLTKMFGIDKQNLRVLSPFVGGGFGGKGAVWSQVPLCVLAAKMVGRPVRLALTREGIYRIVGGRTPSEQRVALGADADGKLTALIHTGYTATTPTNDFPEQFTMPARRLYHADTMHIEQAVVELDTTPNTFMRAPGESIGTFALESAIDELSYAVGLDPIELRKRNEPTSDPTNHSEFSSRHLIEAYRLGAEKFGWHRRKPIPRSTRDGDWWVGQGVATAFYPVYRLPTSARVRIDADGSAVVQSSAQEMGMGTATVHLQHAADRLGLPMDRVRFDYGDSQLPPANEAGGSSQTVSVALAVEMAFEKVVKELLSLAKEDERSPLADASFEDVEARDGGLYRRNGGSGERYDAILARAGKPSVEATVKSSPPSESLKYSMQSYGAQFCEVRVHDRTGEVRVTRWVGAFDTGRIINPKTSRSQFMGGIIMGIGMALTEEAYFDERSGRIINPSLAEYHVPVHADVPRIETHFLDIPDPHTVVGAHGIGEIGITGVAAAIANAIYHATGKRVRDLPITLDKLM